MDKRVYLPLEEHGDESNSKNYAIPNGIHISYSKKFDLVFLNVVDINPIDSYGIEWEQSQQCVMLNEKELNKLIDILQNIKNIT